MWKQGNLVPIFKRGDKSIPANYCPVSLLSNLGKILERIIVKHVYNRLYSNNLLYKYQSGSVLAILPLFNLLAFSTIFANHLMQNSIHVWYSAMYQKLLIRFDTGDFCSNYDKMVLRVDFWHGFQIIYQKGNKQSKLIRLHPPLLSVHAGVPQGSVPKTS